MQDEGLRAHLGHEVVRLFRLVNRTCNRAFADLGVSAEQAHVLSVLWEVGPMTMGELQRTLALSSPTLTGSIDRMELQELVRRVPSPADRRAWLIEPRVPAKRRAKIESTVARAEQLCFASLTPGERKDLGRLLEKCIADLEA